MRFRKKIFSILIFILTLSFNLLVFSEEEKDFGPPTDTVL